MQWLLYHPKFISNPIYIAGDSYSGMIVPVLAQEIAKGSDIQAYFKCNNISNQLYIDTLPGSLYMMLQVSNLGTYRQLILKYVF